MRRWGRKFSARRGTPQVRDGERDALDAAIGAMQAEELRVFLGEYVARLDEPERTTLADAWYRHALHADWASPADVKVDFGNASVLKNGRVVFNVAGNKYRLVVWINFPYRVVYVRFVGTHAQYDWIDAQTV